ncbi:MULTISPECIES: hypothetical protein [unclassified Streptomyces]
MNVAMAYTLSMGFSSASGAVTGCRGLTARYALDLGKVPYS